MIVERTWRREDGVVLVMVLGGLVGLSAIAMTVALLATVDTEIDAVARSQAQTMAMAETAVELTSAELALEADWNAVLSGVVVSRALPAERSPALPGWGALDLASFTARLQRESDARAVWHDNASVWRLYLHGRLGDLLAARSPPLSAYVAVWVADDEVEEDRDPARDTNGMVALRAEAYGAGRAHQVVVATIRRRAHGVQLVSWRAAAD